MPLTDPATRQAAINLLQEAERTQNIRVLSAYLAPALEDGRMYGAGHGETDLRVAFVRPPDAYLGIDHQTEFSQGRNVIEQAGITLKALDLRDAFSTTSRNPVFMMQGAMSLYMDHLTGEALVKSNWPSRVAVQLTEVGPRSREYMAQAADQFVAEGLRQLDAAHQPAAAAAARIEDGNWFGGAPAVDGPAIERGTRETYLSSVAVAAMAVRTALATGPLPNPEDLDFPRSMRDAGVDSLRDLLRNPPAPARIREIGEMTRQFVTANLQPGQHVTHAFGGAAVEQRPEGLREWAQAVNRGLANQIRDARPALTERPAEVLLHHAVVNGELQAIDAALQAQPALPRPAAPGTFLADMRIPGLR